ncbi:hypothetical protein IWX49DRAFT_589662 [Phyllosticta citricarpa]|uniref:Uncharacterized protein n=1 Tax=Phyllosticta citricarpa TaxID=55181 RepID=A0ABR1MJN2_9PEZI
MPSKGPARHHANVTPELMARAYECVECISPNYNAMKAALKKKWPEFFQLHRPIRRQIFHRICTGDKAKGESKTIPHGDIENGSNVGPQNHQNHQPMDGMNTPAQWLRDITGSEQEHISFLDMETGQLILSTPIDYNHATIAELWTELYNEDPAETELFLSFADQFRAHHDGERTSGMRPSDVESALRRAGFSLQSHCLLSYRSRVDMTAVIKILEKDDRTVSPRYELADLNNENFQPGSVHCLLQSDRGGAGAKLSAAPLQLFPWWMNHAYYAEMFDAQAMWRFLMCWCKASKE